MKIKGNLIFVKHTGSLTSFIVLGDTDINPLNFEKKEDLVIHALVFLPRLFSKLKVQFRGVFRTKLSIYYGAFWQL